MRNLSIFSPKAIKSISLRLLKFPFALNPKSLTESI